VLAVIGLAACGEAAPHTMAQERAVAAEPPAAVAAAPAAARDTTDPGVGRLDAAQSLDVSRRSAIVTAASRVGPATVSVNVTRRQRRSAGGIWDFFFMPREFERVVPSLGSGFVVSADGLVITNQHVTAGAEEIIVTSRDGTDYPATLLGEDPLSDIAVLQIDARDLPVAPIGHTTDLMVGEWVVAIGNPFGYLLGNSEPTVTAGVVSGVGRDLLPQGGQEGAYYVGMIQTDAAINPGNSGGPLVNALGEVIGVNSSIFSRSGGSVGVGFAIPIERALRIATQLREHGEIRRAWVGLSVVGADRMRDWKRVGGLEITNVASGGPADDSGLRAGDVLVHAGNHAVRTFLDWEAVKLDVGPGDRLTVAFVREGRRRTATLRVSDLPTTLAEKIDVLGALELITLTTGVRQERGIRSERGALIFDIAEAAQRSTALRPGDVIVRINQWPVTSAEDVRTAFDEASGRVPVRVVFERGGMTGFTDFRINRR
jgi:serine protease Do